MLFPEKCVILLSAEIALEDKKMLLEYARMIIEEY